MLCYVRKKKETATERPLGRGCVALVEQYKKTEHFKRFVKKK